VARKPGRPLERIKEDTRRNFWLAAASAVRYGLAGRVVEHAEDIDTPTQAKARR